jgi:DNA-binding NarL/FixJ family response regulator
MRGVLTERQRLILSYMAAGNKASRIGLLMGTTEQTVKNQLADIRLRLECATTTEAVAKAIRSGVIN